MHRSLAGVAVSLALASCGSGDAGPVGTAVPSPSPSAMVSLPVKCPPPPAVVEIDAGAQGNEWELPVEVGRDTSVEVDVVVHEGRTVEYLRVEVMPADEGGPAIGGPGYDPHAPPGPPVVWWSVVSDRDLRAGEHRFEVGWHGTTTAGEPVEPGRYHLQGFAVVTQDAHSDGPCAPSGSSESYSGGGLGYFTVES